ncbi:hypothetical protein KQ51_00095 [Candidatus Izimaplasma bacterium HR1]|jgi:hypothetical protein|uniref:hypothetical protein n=1 Tax=Candidatus Izimoplasma sp. HR1 TaxID=1541959 RepID=UPI0004F7FC3E|nr:hypothetical protein KQ51_00095 [Candidatus Izimaplasma bacterium HR1]
MKLKGIDLWKFIVVEIFNVSIVIYLILTFNMVSYIGLIMLFIVTLTIIIAYYIYSHHVRIEPVKYDFPPLFWDGFWYLYSIGLILSIIGSAYLWTYSPIQARTFLMNTISSYTIIEETPSVFGSSVTIKVDGEYLHIDKYIGEEYCYVGTDRYLYCASKTNSEWETVLMGDEQIGISGGFEELYSNIDMINCEHSFESSICDIEYEPTIIIQFEYDGYYISKIEVKRRQDKSIVYTIGFNFINNTSVTFPDDLLNEELPFFD